MFLKSLPLTTIPILGIINRVSLDFLNSPNAINDTANRNVAMRNFEMNNVNVNKKRWKK